VAPDHQGTKAIVRQFEKLLAQPDVRFCGNLEIGRDMGWDEVVAAYDAVIIATGMVIDRKLGVPGEELAHVWGSWRFVAWLNGHPDFRGRPDLTAAKRVAVIGNGNVAIDVARVLAKSADEWRSRTSCPRRARRSRRRDRQHRHYRPGADPSTPSFTTTNWPRWAASRVRCRWSTLRRSMVAAPASDPTAGAAAQDQEPRDPARVRRQRGRQQPNRLRFLFNTRPRRSRRATTICRDLHRLQWRRLSKGDSVFPVGWASVAPARQPSRPTEPTVTGGPAVLAC